jgi:hypothetical protein
LQHESLFDIRKSAEAPLSAPETGASAKSLMPTSCALAQRARVAST